MITNTLRIISLFLIFSNALGTSGDLCPCENGGECVTINSSYSFCDCKKDFYGGNCAFQCNNLTVLIDPSDAKIAINGDHFSCSLDLLSDSNQATSKTFIFKWLMGSQLYRNISSSTPQSTINVKDIKFNIVDETIHCCIEQRYKDICPSITSTEYCISINNTITVEFDKSIREGETGRLQVKPLIYPEYLCDSTLEGDVSIEAEQVHSKSTDYSCNKDNRILAQLVFKSNKYNKCGYDLNERAKDGIYNMEVRAKYDRVYEDKDYNVSIKLWVVKRQNGNIICKKQLSQVQVNIIKDITLGVCTSTGNSHLKTYNGIQLINNLYGESILYKHDTLPYQINSLTYRCSSEGVACNCGIVVRCGNDVIRVNHCPIEVVHSNRSYNITELKVYVYSTNKRGGITSGLDLFDIDNGYMVTLPTGTEVSIQRFNVKDMYYADITLRPSASDVHHVLGLCGTVDGNMNSDLIDPSGEMYQGYNKKDMKQYLKLWQVAVDDSFIFGYVSEVEDGQSNDRYWCECSSDGNVRCLTGNDVETCVRIGGKLKSILGNQAISSPRHNSNYIIHPSKKLISKEFSWPTKSGIKESFAHETCREKISNSPLSKKCAFDANYLEDKVNNCICDVQFQDTLSVAEQFHHLLRSECIRLFNDKPKKEKSQIIDALNFESMIDYMCSSVCSIQGKCNEGKCLCLTGWTGIDCNIATNATPQLNSIANGGQCHLDIGQNATDCRSFVVNGLDFVDSENLKCQFTPVQLSGLTYHNVNGSLENFTSPAEYSSFRRLKCVIPQWWPVRSYEVRILNGEKASSPALYTPVYKGCYTCSGVKNMVCLVKTSNACYILGKCQVSGYNLTSCYYCDPDQSAYKWSLRDNDVCNSKDVVETMAKKLGISKKALIAIVCSSLAFVILVMLCLFWKCCCRD